MTGFSSALSYYARLSHKPLSFTGTKPTTASPLPHLVSVEFLISAEVSLHANDPRGNSDPSTTQRFRERASTAVIGYGVVLPDSKSLDLHLPGSTFSFLPHCKGWFSRRPRIEFFTPRKTGQSKSQCINRFCRSPPSGKQTTSVRSGSVYSKTAMQTLSVTQERASARSLTVPPSKDWT